MKLSTKNKAITVILSLLILIFIIMSIYIKFFVISPLEVKFDENDTKIEELRSFQSDKEDLLDKISTYRDGLFSLKLLLEARKNVLSGYDEENPHLIYNFKQVLDDLRKLLPKDARVTKFQVNNKGLLTIPIESVDYASLGRVLKSFKDKNYDEFDTEEEQRQNPKMFTEVKIPSGAQRMKKVITLSRWSKRIEFIYSFVIQAQLRPEFWKNEMPFPDVEPRAYYAEAIRDLNIADIISGYPDGNFRPDQSINRAEFFKISLFRFLATEEITIDEYREFIDSTETDWHYKYVQMANKMGIAEGDDVNKFHPDQTLTRIEALKTILTIFDIEIEGDPELEEGESKKPIILPFNDIKPTDEIYSIVRTAIKNGLLDNINKKLEPNKNATRAEITYWVWKLEYDYLETNVSNK